MKLPIGALWVKSSYIQTVGSQMSFISYFLMYIIYFFPKTNMYCL